MVYIYIRAWGQMMGSRVGYVEDVVEQAREDHAPQDAIYKRQDGSWVTAREASGPAAEDLKQMVKRWERDNG